MQQCGIIKPYGMKTKQCDKKVHQLNVPNDSNENVQSYLMFAGRRYHFVAKKVLSGRIMCVCTMRECLFNVNVFVCLFVCVYGGQRKRK